MGVRETLALLLDFIQRTPIQNNLDMHGVTLTCPLNRIQEQSPQFGEATQCGSSVRRSCQGESWNRSEVVAGSVHLYSVVSMTSFR